MDITSYAKLGRETPRPSEPLRVPQDDWSFRSSFSSPGDRPGTFTSSADELTLITRSDLEPGPSEKF